MIYIFKSYTFSFSHTHMWASYKLFRLLMISALFLKIEGKNRVKEKKIPYFGDVFWEISLIFNVRC